MSWMDSWSRPGKHAATPPPLYETQGAAIKYCQSCGRVMTEASKNPKAKTEEKKYCSSRCRSQKPGPQDRRIEDAFVALLRGDATFEEEPIPETILSKRTKPLKGEPRVVVPCSAVEELIFGSRHDPTKTWGRKKNRASRAIGEDGDEAAGYLEEKEDRMVEFNTKGFAGKVRPPQNMTEINGSVGGEKGRAEKIEETEEAAARRKEGLRITEEKERVKRAARRGVIFGFLVAHNDGAVKKADGSEDRRERRKCEAIMNGSVVEPSFAKGDWGIRWRS